MRLNKTTLVKFILTQFPKTRDDDYLLWAAVLQHTQPLDRSTDYLNMSVYQFLSVAKYMTLPHFETISRIRRKLQEEYPELRASAETQAARDELEESFRAFAHSNV